MLIVETPRDLAAHVGQKLGTSDWVEVTQEKIAAFADITGDHNWIHVDVERAKREMPGGRCIAHGCLTLSLMAQMSYGIYEIRRKSRGVFYGTNKGRFTAPVSAGSRIRLHETLKEAVAVEGGYRFTTECSIEVEGSSRPAMVAETIVMSFD